MSIEQQVFVLVVGMLVQFYVGQCVVEVKVVLYESIEDFV